MVPCRIYGCCYRCIGVEHKKFHALRHTHATKLLAAGKPIMDVSRRLGHSKPSHTLDLYGHAMPGKDDEIANSIAYIYNLVDKKKEPPITGRKIMRINDKRRTSN